MADSQDIFISEVDFRKRYDYGQGDLLGEGGFAQVFKAFDKQFKEFVALKFYNKGEKGKYDVLNEMKGSRSFSHKNIIRVHDAFVVRFEHAGTHSFVQVGVLEFANGGNLRDFVSSKPSEEIFIDVLKGILEALHYLHSEKNIIHRDLSPENILMCREHDVWVPKISDFGISKKIDYGVFPDEKKKSTQLLGKFDYMAPEQFLPEKFGVDGSIGTNVDLWAFGIILYELFMNTTPYGLHTEDNPMRTVQSIINEPLPDLINIPEPYRRIIARCLEKKARKRVQSSVELISILMSKTKEYKTKDVASINFTRSFPKPFPIIRWVLISILGLAIFVGGFFFVHYMDNKKSASIISEIKGLMAEERYLEVIEIYNSLPERKRKIAELSVLYEDSRLKEYQINLSNMISDKQFFEAVKYFNNLPGDVKTDTALNTFYKQADIYLKADSIKFYIENNNLDRAMKFYAGLENEYKSHPDVLSLNEEIIKLKTIDSLIIYAKNQFNTRNYQQAQLAFRSVLTKYDPNNRDALLMVAEIDKILSAQIGNKVLVKESDPCLQRFLGNTLRIHRYPDKRIVEIISICITDSEMKITLEIKPSGEYFKVFSPISPNSFYLRYNGVSQRPKDILGIIVNRDYMISEPMKVDIIFDKLPANVESFNLLEGMDQKDLTRIYWNFENIQIL
ncbi:MAG: serine/threonine-protein kinase [Ignavibacteriaceae bacterium]